MYFVGSALEDLRAFPRAPRREVGYQLERVQLGLEPSDWRPMTTIGSGAREIRIQHRGEFRVIYVAKIDDAVHVLHAFQKKTQKTRKRDLEVARQRLKEMKEKK
ncbi:MAG: type II toxin-antitoxin system RelE/ParE family toxin [Gammaproteobacteria bacterium]|nr:type II toxin-antitoxin system RelE/ParE family toxin [Gammaproteobacteria bacterium]